MIECEKTEEETFWYFRRRQEKSHKVKTPNEKTSKLKTVDLIASDRWIGVKFKASQSLSNNCVTYNEGILKCCAEFSFWNLLSNILIEILWSIQLLIVLKCSRQAPMGAWHPSGLFGQLAELGQHRLPQELGQDCSRHLSDRPQPLQRHAPRLVAPQLKKLAHLFRFP